jgi:DNA ligase (NAD+)
MAAGEAELMQAPDIGPIVAAHIAAFFHEQHNREVIAALRAHGVHWQDTEPQGEPAGPLLGQTVVLTGSLVGFTRDEAKRNSRPWARRCPAAFRRRRASSWPVPRRARSWPRPRSLGIRILDEDAFAALLREHE